MVVNSTGDTTATINSYQCRKSKFGNILSTLHKNVVITEHNNPKRKPKTVLFHNQTKVGGNVLDQMSRLHLVKTAYKRCPVNIFYNITNMALIKSCIIYKAVCKSNISHRVYIQKICKELTGSLNDARESLTFERPTRSSTACFATRKLKKECVTACSKKPLHVFW